MIENNNSMQQEAGRASLLPMSELSKYKASLRRMKDFKDSLNFINELGNSMFCNDKNGVFKISDATRDYFSAISSSVSFALEDRTDLFDIQKNNLKDILTKEFDKLWTARRIRLTWESEGNPYLTNVQLADILDIKIDILEIYFKRIELTSEHV